MRRGRGERREALDDLAAAGTDVLPFHDHVAELPRVEKEIDRLTGRQAVLLGEPLGIDAHELAVVRRTGKVEEQLVHSSTQPRL